VTALEQALRQICADLSTTRHPFALVGGLAVSARTEPRFTRDADIAVAVARSPRDSEAQAIAAVHQSRHRPALCVVGNRAGDCGGSRRTRAAATAPCARRDDRAPDCPEGSRPRRCHSPARCRRSASSPSRSVHPRHHPSTIRAHVDCGTRIPPRTRSAGGIGEISTLGARSALTTWPTRFQPCMRVRLEALSNQQVGVGVPDARQLEPDRVLVKQIEALRSAHLSACRRSPIAVQ